MSAAVTMLKSTLMMTNVLPNTFIVDPPSGAATRARTGAAGYGSALPDAARISRTRRELPRKEMRGGIMPRSYRAVNHNSRLLRRYTHALQFLETGFQRLLLLEQRLR